MFSIRNTETGEWVKVFDGRAFLIFTEKSEAARCLAAMPNPGLHSVERVVVHTKES